MTYHERLTLDTCALLWLASGSDRLSQEARDAIDKASMVFLCPISAWEISLKVAQEKLRLPLSPYPWFTAVQEKHNLILAALSPQVLCAANELPWHHRDPADRFIIATALGEKSAIVTADEKIRRYDVETLC